MNKKMQTLLCDTYIIIHFSSLQSHHPIKNSVVILLKCHLLMSHDTSIMVSKTLNFHQPK